MNSNKWSSEEIARFEEFHDKAIIRLERGESEESVFRDKPEGYSEWLKEHYEKTGGIKLPKSDSLPKYQCWKCKKDYYGRKCPYCGSFKPRNVRV